MVLEIPQLNNFEELNVSTYPVNFVNDPYNTFGVILSITTLHIALGGSVCLQRQHFVGPITCSFVIIFQF